MMQLTPVAMEIVAELARRHGVGEDAVVNLLYALVAGNGCSAQFNHPDLGGPGQWMAGGMIMVGDMFNQQLKAKVDALCNELAALLAREPSLQRGQGGGQSQHQYQGGAQSQAQPGTAYTDFGGASLFTHGSRGAQWWPPELGSPASSGSQNDVRYAYFPQHRRLAVDVGGIVTVYDTGDRHISGVSQQQSHGTTLIFVGREGPVAAADLPVVAAGEAARSAPAADPAPAPAADPAATGSGSVREPRRGEVADAASAISPPRTERAPQPHPKAQEDVIEKIERLAALRDKGVLTDAEFDAKKTELLARL